MATLLLEIGVGLLACIVFESRWAHLSAHDRAYFHPPSISLAWINSPTGARRGRFAGDHGWVLGHGGGRAPAIALAVAAVQFVRRDV